MKIVKNDHTGKPVWEYPGECIKQTENAMLFRAYFNRKDLEFQGVCLREGDLFLELYPLNKWFNIFEIHDKDSGVIKAWYCNVTRPVSVNGDVLSYDDLALDLFAYPDGRYRILDEDEFYEIEIPDRDRAQAIAGLDELKAIFSGKWPITINDFQNFL